MNNRTYKIMKTFKIVIAMLLALPAWASAQKQPDLVQYANTLQGTNSNFGLSHGNTFPATAMPYGVHEWTPQTNVNGEGFKYLYAHDKIRGFGQSHQCSPWVSDYAVYTFMPEVGKLVVNENDRATKFSHDNEIGRPHYYKVKFDNGITTEMAPTDRGVHLRFSYPKGQDAFLVIDGYTDTSEVKIDVPSSPTHGQRAYAPCLSTLCSRAMPTRRSTRVRSVAPTAVQDGMSTTPLAMCPSLSLTVACHRLWNMSTTTGVHT